MIVTDHSDYDYQRIVREAKLVVDTRNATKGIDSPKIVRCEKRLNLSPKSSHLIRTPRRPYSHQRHLPVVDGNPKTRHQTFKFIF